MPLAIPADPGQDPAMPHAQTTTALHSFAAAASPEEAGVVVLLGYGAACDVGVTNQSISTYARVLHRPADGGEPQVHLRWLPKLGLPSGITDGLKMSIADGTLSLWFNDIVLLHQLPLPGWRPRANWAVGVHGFRGAAQSRMYVDNLQIASGSLHMEAEVPVLLANPTLTL